MCCSLLLIVLVSAFGDTICSLSLLSDVGFGKDLVSFLFLDLMESEMSNGLVDYAFMLSRRSLLVMKGESRYAWKHAISSRKVA